MTGGELVVDGLVRHGIDTLFAVPGEQLNPLFAALHGCRDRIRTVHTRHEQGAAYMAYGFARSTGRVGAFAVPPGPGLLNAGAALATGYAGNAPMLCLTGQLPVPAIGRGYGLLHEIPDQTGVLRSLTKWTGRPEHATQIEPLLNECFRSLESGRRRPVGFEVSPDVLEQRAERAGHEAVRPQARAPQPDPADIARAAALLARAERPLILVGGGAVDAGEDLLAIAQALQAPVVANCSGRGIIGDGHELALTWPAGHRLWRDADVVLAVGTRLYQPQAAWGLDRRLAIVRIDIDPAELARVQPPTVGIVADAGVALAALREALVAASAIAGAGGRASRRRELGELKDEFAGRFAALQPQMDYLGAIRDELPDDGFFVDELTQVGYVARFAFPVHRPRTFVPASYQGTLGFGFAAALGVKVANPGKAVVSINGDGGFMYTASELATAAQHRIGVVAIVFNDGGYGNVRRSQREAGYALGCDLVNPDFVALAHSFGVDAARVARPNELRRELRAALGRPGPTVIEVPVGDMPSPWPFIRLPRARGESGAR